LFCSTTSRGSSMKAAVLIQRWYRRYMARLEMRRRYTWNIFQSIEYAGEQDQLQVSLTTGIYFANFRSIIKLKHLLDPVVDPWLDRETCYNLIHVPESYTGPRLSFPLSVADTNALLSAFKDQQTLHARYVLQLLYETKKLLKQMPNIVHLSTSYYKEITICGDLHGRLDDLLLIFYKNGLPSAETPYVFNGDFVDRGKKSVEVVILLFAFLLLYPDYMHLNRGNHEDHIMNLRYGFTKEVMQKYKTHGSEILQLFQDVFSLLPIATVIDGKILITDLDFLSSIETQINAYRKSILLEDIGFILHCNMKPISYYNKVIVVSQSHDHLKTKQQGQIVDILWSDPKIQDGCSPNTFRGGGCYFGPDLINKTFIMNINIMNIK
uniref:Serine/threonine-protein phosphatase n=1 Tax=Oreochromis aureus TaxID=47969 RepID=A0A668S8X7_OREAU